MKYLGLYENFKEDIFRIEKRHPDGYVDNFFKYYFFVNDEYVGYMLGLLENNIFNVTIIYIEDDYRKKSYGEKFIIKFLKDNPNITIYSDNETRKEVADKMWQRISKNPNIDVKSKNIKSHFTWDGESYNIYTAKLKRN
jgi:hypothetical protein